MDNWRETRGRARAARALLGPSYADAPAGVALDALLRHWDVEVDAVAPDHPLLRGARAAWREEYDLVLVDATLPAPERAFAVAHELGHRACHRGGCACEAGDIDEEAPPVALPVGEGRVWGYNPRQAREVEANVFAGELLAPAADLRARFLAGEGYRALAETYGVTPTCVLNGLVGAVLGGTAEGFGEDARVNPPGLDASQRAAAETTGACVLVDAGPGTGKTHTLVARVLHLTRTAGVPAPEILALTFSNRAADELRERLRRAAPEAAGIIVATFHGFALDVLRRFAPRAGLPDEFGIVDDLDAALLLERALPALDLEHYARLTRPSLYLPSLLDACGRMRDELLTPREVAASIDDACTHDEDDARRARLRETRRLLDAYEDLLAAHGLVDYGGLIARVVELLRSDPAVAATVRGGLRHVLVDEYQDVNRASAVLLRELVRDDASLWVVGDVRQSIYRFRGAEPRNVFDFERDFPGGVRLALDVNYRAVPALVAMLTRAAGAMTGAVGRWTAQRPARAGDAPALAVAPDEEAERAGIVADIARSIDAGHRPEEHAVLCRTHRQAAAVAAALGAAGLPTSYLGAFFLRPEIKDLLALLELCDGPDGSALPRLARWPEYRVDEETVEEVIRAARERDIPFPAALRDADLLSGLPDSARAALARLSAHVEAARRSPDPAAVLVRYLCGDAPYLRRLARDPSAATGQALSAIFQLIALARGFTRRPPLSPDAGTTRAFLRYVRRLLAGGEMGVSRAVAVVPGAVNVLTIHASKGLEFPVVYVPNLAAGRFPPRARGGARVALPPVLERVEGEQDDEQSLFFVALSRATDRLVLSRAARYGGRPHQESPLLRALRAVYPLVETAWPEVEPRPDGNPPPMRERGNDVAVAARAVEDVARCPTRYHYQDRLGPRDDAHGYGLFARLLRGGVRELRTDHGTAAWPVSWDEAAARAAARWDERWPADDPLGPWYRATTLRALERVYHEMQRSEDTSARYGEDIVVDVEGTAVSVHIDALTEIDGVASLVLERATRTSDEATSIAVGLYGAAARAIAPDAPAPVVIRHLDTGETRPVPDPTRVLDKHRTRIRLALHQIESDAFPTAPRDDDECARCPFVFVCPR